MSNLDSVIAVIPVKNHAAAVTWYSGWLGRDVDVVPMDGVAEWQITDTAWLQVAEVEGAAGGATVIFGVTDLDAQLEACKACGVDAGEVEDYGFVRTADIRDPEGNTISFAQEVGEA